MTGLILTQDDAKLSKLLTFLEMQYKTIREPVGFKIEHASTAPTISQCDRTGEKISLDADFFYYHELWGSMLKCTLTSNGVPSYGTIPNGAGLDLTGTNGDVMVKVPNPQYRYWYEEENDTQFYLYAPFDSNHAYFKYHPNCYSGGGTLKDHFFIGAYEGSLGLDASGNKIIRSITGVQPWTGGQIRSLSFANGNTEFTIGETLTGATSGVTGIVIAYRQTSGDWSLGTATGTVYLKNPNVDVSVAGQQYQSGESITRVVGSATSNGSYLLDLKITDALTYASNKGAGWTLVDIWADSVIKGLFCTQYGTFNIQTAIGSGIVNLSGVGFAGKNTGSDSIDSPLNDYGTRTGVGTSGQVAVSWNNLQNLSGNCSEYLAGINVFTDGSYYVRNRDGTGGAITGILADGTYEIGTGMPVTDGFISAIQTDELGAIAFIPRSVNGTTETSCFGDYFDFVDSSPSVILTRGNWASQNKAGVGYWQMAPASTTTFRNIASRLKYIPQI